jgi:tRNA G18 (ribose-2'-O)-methylase SpoU
LSGTLDPDVLWSVLIGSEAHGLADDVVSLATVRVTIPMPGGTESLNAAVAAAVLMYEISTWRTSTSSNGDRPDR